MLENVKEIQCPAKVALCCTHNRDPEFSPLSFSCFLKVKEKGHKNREARSAFTIAKMENTGGNFSVYQILIVLLKLK